jgi:hypothetical protein
MIRVAEQGPFLLGDRRRRLWAITPSSELSLITLYRNHRMEMISTFTDMVNAYVKFSRMQD